MGTLRSAMGTVSISKEAFDAQQKEMDRMRQLLQQQQPIASTTLVTPPDIMAELERMRAENAALKAQHKNGRGVSLKVSEKGGVSVYGLGRFPVTLYKEQWTKLLDMADDIRAFIVEHDSELKMKGDK